MRKTQDIRKFNMDKIEEALSNSTSLKKVKLGLGLGKSEIFALKNSEGEVTRNRNEIIKIAEEFYTKLYSSNQEHVSTSPVESEVINVPEITVEEVKNALKGFKKNKAGGEDGITFEHIKEAGDLVLSKLASLYSKCLKYFYYTSILEKCNNYFDIQERGQQIFKQLSINQFTFYNI